MLQKRKKGYKGSSGWRNLGEYPRIDTIKKTTREEGEMRIITEKENEESSNLDKKESWHHPEVGSESTSARPDKKSPYRAVGKRDSYP